jgi:hypothetical protein
MTNSKKHGGKRKGAGRKPKWDPLFKLRVGQDCESLFRQEEELAKKKAIDEHFSTKTDIKNVWDKVHKIPIPRRSNWLKSEAGDQHISDIEEELETLRATSCKHFTCKPVAKNTHKTTTRIAVKNHFRNCRKIFPVCQTG